MDQQGSDVQFIVSIIYIVFDLGFKVFSDNKEHTCKNNHDNHGLDKKLNGFVRGCVEIYCEYIGIDLSSGDKIKKKVDNHLTSIKED